MPGTQQEPPIATAILLGALVRGTLRPSDLADVDMDAAHTEILCAIEASMEVHRGRVSVGAVLRALRSLGWPTGARCYAMAAMLSSPTRRAALDARDQVAGATAYARAIYAEADDGARAHVRLVARLVTARGCPRGVAYAGVLLVGALGGYLP